jgi:hypothetical protein
MRLSLWPWAPIIFLAILAPHTFSGVDSGSAIEGIRIGLTQNNTRVVFDLESPANYHLRDASGDTKELILDFDHTRLLVDLDQLRWQGSHVSSIRSEILNETDLRLVIQLSDDVNPTLIPWSPIGDKKSRLILDLKSVRAVSDRPAEVTAIRVGRHIGYSRVVVDFGSDTAHQLHLSDDQLRVSVSFESATIAERLLALPLSGTLIESVTLQSANELVFTLTTPVTSQAMVVPPNNEKGHRLAIDFFPDPAVVGQSELPIEQSEVGAKFIRGGEVTNALEKSKRPADVSSVRAPVTVAGPSVEVESAHAYTNRPMPKSLGPEVSFSGTVAHEWAVASTGGNQKFETTVEPRWDIRFGDRATVTAIARMGLDLVGDLGPAASHAPNYSSINGQIFNNENVSLELREFFVDLELGESYLRMGKQQVVWGQADGIKVLDVVNPQSYSEFILADFDDSRIPLWMLNWELPFGDDSELQFLWISDPTYHELAEFGTPYYLTSPLLVPANPLQLDVTILEPDKPNDVIDDSDLGIRYRTFLGGWDVTLNYLYSYTDFPVAYQRLSVESDILTAVLEPSYERNNLVGGTLSNALGEFSVRGEFAWNSDVWLMSTDYSIGGVESSEEIAFVLGLDWQRSSSTMVSLQWFQSHLLDYKRTIVRDQTENMVSVLVLQTFDNQSWEFRALALHSLNYEDSMAQFKLKYWLRSNLEIWAGADLFFGDEFGVFGQFSDYDRLLFGLRYGF